MINSLPKSLIETASKHLTHIDVDGEMKHRYNSDGKPIHHTEDGIRNFHRWFGDSKAVDEHGRPSVVYHGTTKTFDKFDNDKIKEGGYLRFGPGHYLTDDHKTFNTYSNEDGGNVMPSYVSLKNPQQGSAMTHDQIHKFFGALQDKKFPNGYDATHDHEKFKQQALDEPEHAFSHLTSIQGNYISKNDWLRGIHAAGIDGIKQTVFGKQEYVAMHPTQIKSAIGNIGRFDPEKHELSESTEQTHIDVDGEMKHRYNSEDQLIHHTDDGIKNFHRWFGDSDSVDEQGRPKVFHHGSPVLSRSQDENTPLPFNEFNKSGSGVHSFSPEHKFAHQYASTKSMDSSSDMAPFVFKTYLKTKTFDPRNAEHIAAISDHLGETVPHEGKYGWSAWGGEQHIPKDKFIEKLQGIHDIYRPLTKEMHDKAEVGTTIGIDGGREYVHHKTPTHLYTSAAYQMDSLQKEHFDDLKSEAQKEPTSIVRKEYKFTPYPERPWQIKRSKVAIGHYTYLPGKETGDNWEYTENDHVKAAAQKLGFNAIKQTESNHANVAVFDNSQIKSSTHNTGDFSHPTKIDN